MTTPTPSSISSTYSPPGIAQAYAWLAAPVVTNAGQFQDSEYQAERFAG